MSAKEPSAGAWVASGLIVLGVGPVTRGYVLSLLWLWFAVPLGAPPLGIAHALGLALLVATAAGSLRGSRERKKGWEAMGEAIALAVVAPWLLLGVGAIVREFM